MNIPHPFPYQGSKRRIAHRILGYFPTDKNVRLFEPFAGSAAISLAAATYRRANKFIINDANEPLIELWQNIVNKPEGIIEKYRHLWQEQEGKEQEYYNYVRDKFNKTKKPEYLLYLLARCVKASIRYNSLGGFNQSPDNRRKGMSPDGMKENILRTASLLKGKVEFNSTDYTQILKKINQNDVVYMDPPYQGVCSARDPRYIQNIQFGGFVDFLSELNRKRISFIVSYDGRTGNRQHGERLPESLGLVHIEINAGKSSQATLLGKSAITYESVYLSKALLKRVSSVPSANEEQLELMESFS